MEKSTNKIGGRKLIEKPANESDNEELKDLKKSEYAEKKAQLMN
jgi:hypothetical protein